MTQEGLQYLARSRDILAAVAVAEADARAAGFQPRRRGAPRVQDALKERRLRVVLAAFEPPRLPVSIVYPNARLLPARTRAFVDAAKRELAPLFQG